MSWGHTHKWIETERAYAPPVGRFNAIKCSEELYERMVFGLTTIIQRCEDCGELRTTEVKGPTNGGGIRIGKA